VLREAVSGRQFCIQNTFNSGEYWRLKYSAQSGFATDSGTPITVVPSAADEVVIFGGNTDASPGTVQFMQNNAAYYMQCGVNTAAPHNFYMACYDKTTGTTQTLFYLDILTAGTYPNTDADPAVICCKFGSGCGTASSISNESIGPACWYRYGLAGAGYVVTTPMIGTNSGGLTIVPGGVGSNALTNDDNIFPFFYIRRGALSSPTGYKGVSSMIMWKGNSRIVSDTGNGNSKFVFGDILLPYDSATTPAL
jgi:hypothetical protein